VAQKDALLAGCPVQDDRIGGRGKAYSLDLQKIKVGLDPEKAADDAIAEILVTRQPNHREACCAFA
jgi:hypothetical protein